MKRFPVLLCCLLCGLRLSAAPAPPVPPADSTFLQRATRFVTRLSDRIMALPPVQFFQARDTSYYSQPDGNWTARIRSNLSGNRIRAAGSDGQAGFKTVLSDPASLSQTIGLSYKGFSLSHTFNPWRRESHDIKYDFSAYSNMLGVNLTYRTISSYRGYTESGGQRIADITGERASRHLFAVNAFGILNYRRFSFPATFNQSYIQHKSAGSLIAGLSYGNDQTEIPAVGESPLIHVDSRIVSAGAGYGYTFVPHRFGWQVMVVALPKVIFYNSQRLRSRPARGEDIPERESDIRLFLRHPEFDFSAQLAAVKWFYDRYFIGFSATLDGYSIHIDGYRLTQSRWETNLTLGARF